LSLEQALFYTVWLMRSPVNSSVSTRLRLVRALADVISQAAGLLRDLDQLRDKPPSEAAEMLDRISNLAIYAVYLHARDASLKGILSRYLSSWQHIKTNITGNDLQQAGLEPGPRYAEILSQLRNAWLDGKVKTDREEQDLLEGLLRETSP
jgi:tRNA nucleotidyltransferase (CCA-adding enzyme)